MHPVILPAPLVDSSGIPPPRIVVEADLSEVLLLYQQGSAACLRASSRGASLAPGG